jgi:futalosine hydrolase
MPVCIVAATELEIPAFAASGNNHRTLITGIGSTATTYHLLQEIHAQRPTVIIQAGIAGSFNPSTPLASAFIVQRDRFADLGVTEQGQWKDIFDLGLTPADQFPNQQGWLVNHHQQLLQIIDLPLVDAITINQVTTDSSRMEQITSKYQPELESMEGAAFHFVCLQQDIPFIQLRTVSNYIGERNKNNWQIRQAVSNLEQQLHQLLAKLPAHYLQAP